jgi:hypothetical protein
MISWPRAVVLVEILDHRDQPRLGDFPAQLFGELAPQGLGRALDGTAGRPPALDGAGIVAHGHDQQLIAAPKDADGDGADDRVRSPRRRHSERNGFRVLGAGGRVPRQEQVVLALIALLQRRPQLGLALDRGEVQVGAMLCARAPRHLLTKCARNGAVLQRRPQLKLGALSFLL